MDDPAFVLRLAKEDFKFSVAHFTVFGADEGEAMHGHNYQVVVEVGGRRLDELGLLVPVAELKRAIRAACRRLDDKTLIPERCPHLAIEVEGGVVVVRFAGRTYTLPESEVRLLPLENTTIELLARFLWEDLAQGLHNLPVDRLAVCVDETAGQGCRYEAPLGP
jgi:6-pyruvoyltetrahydropterin/6-carboxytetrahydropterin synthase